VSPTIVSPHLILRSRESAATVTPSDGESNHHDDRPAIRQAHQSRRHLSRGVDPGFTSRRSDHPRDHRPRTVDHPCARSWWARGRCGVQVRLHPDAWAID